MMRISNLLGHDINSLSFVVLVEYRPVRLLWFFYSAFRAFWISAFVERLVLTLSGVSGGGMSGLSDGLGRFKRSSKFSTHCCLWLSPLSIKCHWLSFTGMFWLDFLVKKGSGELIEIAEILAFNCLVCVCYQNVIKDSIDCPGNFLDFFFILINSLLSTLFSSSFLAFLIFCMMSRLFSIRFQMLPDSNYFIVLFLFHRASWHVSLHVQHEVLPVAFLLSPYLRPQICSYEILRR
ncbi:hypothetical protein DPMN_075692 [Dreissena polymorpha]|uniref:Uncharacterized protein n=1 Tax=Dreissena polymorpha TaxID=45954 RepID=A0A9D4BMR2_DREPO|nr:hypothetical protein DPMN_075692 [Dreissena polymorpha]